MPLNIEKIRKDFPNLKVKVRGGKDLVYLDSAASTFKPQKVIDTICEHYSCWCSNVHRGVHYLSEHSTAHFESSRDKVRGFLNAKEREEVIFTKGTTDAINLVVNSYGRAFLSEGDEIIISEMEHHSNIVPWQILCQEKGCRLKVIRINDAGELDLDHFASLITPKTKFISVVYISNSLGTINPVKEITALARAKNIPVLIDGAQAIGHCRIDVQDLACDFLTFSGHKLFAPTGVGVLYGRRQLLEKMPPYQAGGDMILSVTFEKTTYNHLPNKFEAGTPNIAGVIGLGSAVDYVREIGLEGILEYKRELLQYGTKVLSGIPGLTLIGTAEKKTCIFSFVLDGIHPHDIGSLVDEDGIAIRTGHHCTQPVMKRFGIPASARASLAIYNTTEDIDRLAESLGKIKNIFKK